MKVLRALLVAAAALGMAGVAGAQELPTESFEGTVTEIQRGGVGGAGVGAGVFSILVDQRPNDDTDDECISTLDVTVANGRVFNLTTKVTRLVEGKMVAATPEELKVGQVVRATYEGVAESCPGQAVARDIIILQDEMPDELPDTGAGGLATGLPLGNAAAGLVMLAGAGYAMLRRR